MKVLDLKNHKDKLDLILYCPFCHDEYSTTPGDYWAADPHTVLDCCSQEMLLMRKVITFEEVDPHAYISPDDVELDPETAARYRADRMEDDLDNADS